MFKTISKFINPYLNEGWESVHWFMMEMDEMQWGIVALIFVIAGFMALSTEF